ncbi:MAG: MarP family serine protease [Acidobacteriota bacterium]|nr:MarP family serine protease [Acidobacteriota bacterium]
MSSVDWLIVALLALLALFGFHRGFIVGALSFGGFVLGAFLGTRLAPLILTRGSASPYAPALGLLGALLAGAIMATGLEGIGLRLRRSLRLPALSVFDGLLGAMLAVAVGLGVVWVVAAVVAQAPSTSSLRSAVQRSAIVRTLNELMPPSGPILSALARLDPLPRISGPSTAGLAPPLPALARTEAVRVASRSVVRVLGTACGLAIEGSGWVAAPDLVLTNAHVVAGESDTVVEVGGEPPELTARVVEFDPHDDLALLRVPSLGLPALRLAVAPAAQSAGVILGYPENGAFAADAARIGETQSVLTQDAFGEGPVTRDLTPLRGLVRPGNSGGPVVAENGAVLTTVFASTSAAALPGGYGVANATVAQFLEGRLPSLPNDRCDG